MSYAPYPLESELPDLVATVVTGELGSTVARHHVSRGSTRATVFLHGAAGSWTTWTPLLRDADFAEPVLFDLPGWGDGELRERADARTIDTVCELVRDALLQLGYTQWDLIGHSMGGFIAMHMAAIWPDSVRSVATVSCTSWSVIASVGHPVRDFGVLPAFTSLWQVMRFLSALGRVGRSMVRGMARVHLLRLAVLPLFRHGLRVDHTVIESLSREVRPHSFAAAAEIARGYDADALWAGIRCPVRAVKGDRDVFVRDDDLARLKAILPDARTAVIADCGHFGNVERPAEVLLALGLPRRA